jgi:hypothetical protein
MALNISSLLVHDEAVPARARAAILAAKNLSGARKVESLRSAARALREETDIDCGDAMELVGLSEHLCGEA